LQKDSQYSAHRINHKQSWKIVDIDLEIEYEKCLNNFKIDDDQLSRERQERDIKAVISAKRKGFGKDIFNMDYRDVEGGKIAAPSSINLFFILLTLESEGYLQIQHFAREHYNLKQGGKLTRRERHYAAIDVNDYLVRGYLPNKKGIYAIDLLKGEIRFSHEETTYPIKGSYLKFFRELIFAGDEGVSNKTIINAVARKAAPERKALLGNQADNFRNKVRNRVLKTRKGGERDVFEVHGRTFLRNVIKTKS
jgi:hypothetical protein